MVILLIRRQICKTHHSLIPYHFPANNLSNLGGLKSVGLRGQSSSLSIKRILKDLCRPCNADIKCIKGLYIALVCSCSEA